MIGSILSKVLGRGGGARTGGAGMGGGGMGGGATRGGGGTDAAIGKGVRGILSRFTRR
ncbi:hypothetical protein QWJ41_09505 [Nocardioides sp. SOB44]|jgi:hypothetical protein|uniref:Uncharacterized protein n=2 Tax=Nocardioides TaxID=1839 RepID=A0ABT8TPS7_9ACTN|nr:hypothetical protein [Nocardioides cremeus]MDO3395952.1 hypothetical protein [Nocardioides cremeus]